MSDNGFNSPTPNELRVIHESIPHLAEVREKRQRENVERLAKKAGIKPGDKMCEICFGKILVISKEPRGYCLNCEKNLKAGQTAIVSMDGRYIFIESKTDIEKEKDLFLAITNHLPEKWPDDFTIRGQVLPTPSETMDQLIKINEASEKAPEN
jgi:hypothetical protein